MIVITGAAGFIGSALVAYLNEQKNYNAVLVDNFETPFRLRNLSWKYYDQTIERQSLKYYLLQHSDEVEAVVHLGAKSGYIHEDWDVEKKNFVELHQWLWAYCTEYQKRFLYASSGAVYGDGTYGFNDDDETTFQLQPQHPYAQMRLEVDQWSLRQEQQPPIWVGLRMSNVYGPNEYHKMNNASLVYKAYNEILSYNNMRLFASDRPDVEDGGMTRDFIYVKDVVKIIYYFLNQNVESGIYNVSIGEDISFREISTLVFKELMIPARFEFEPVLESLKPNFPYKVMLPNDRLRSSGYTEKLYSPHEGVSDYINKYLLKGEFY